MTTDSLQALLDELPEIYQPIYGHLDLRSSRRADSPRMAAIESVITRIAEAAGRPLRILDLGAAQGFTAFTLAASGHHVVGVEMLPANVDVARCLARENPSLSTDFVLGDISDVAAMVDLRSFDVVLALSVLHHIMQRDGHDQAVAFVESLAAHIPHGLYEMASSSEPVYWAPALPDDPRITLAGYPFVREVARSATHLSEVERPTLFCSSTHVLINDRVVPIDSYTRRSHQAVGDAQTRLMKYLTTEVGLTKIAGPFSSGVPSFVLATLRDDLRREARVLEMLQSAGIDAPRLIEFVDGPDETTLTKSIYPGELLSEVVAVCNDDELRVVTGDVLDDLAALERAGLSHSDLRLWNVVFDRAGRRARLIDHGAVRTERSDVMWPHDPYFSFLTFLTALWISKQDRTGAELPRAIGLEQPGLPSDVVRVVAAMLVHDRDDHVFGDAARLWRSSAQPDNHPGASTDTGDNDAEATAASWPQLPLAWGLVDAVERQRDDFRVARDAARAAAEARHEEDLGMMSARLESTFVELARLQSELADHRQRAARWDDDQRTAEGRRAFEAAAIEARHDLHRRALEGRLAAADAAHAALVAAGFGQAPAADPAGAATLAAIAEIDALRDHSAGLLAELEATRATVSWRVTRPLRSFRRVLPRRRATRGS